ncbi:ferredoxin-type protein NapF [Pasteurellaceae bacterium Orientalotternb1]|nr:ferredoxin-type protein NapF [Pasteurellaceae bacterium Orientalotternb1]
MSQQDERYVQALLTHRHISRRGLFRGLLNGAKQAYQQNANTVQTRPTARPPQAVEEPLFMHLCNECGDCIRACPYRLLAFSEHKVSLNIDYCACDMCGKCREVCTTGALEKDRKPDTELRPIIDHLCLKQRGMHCQLCEIHCPQNALKFEATQKKLVYNEKCNGCGECKVQCPYGYISLEISPQ